MILLTALELVEYTRRERPKGQAKVLDALGVPFRWHPTDNCLLVSRAAAEAALGVKLADPAPTYEINVPEDKKRGQETTAH